MAHRIKNRIGSLINGALPNITSRNLDFASGVGNMADKRADKKNQPSSPSDSFADKIFGQKEESAPAKSTKSAPAPIDKNDRQEKNSFHKINRRSAQDSKDSQESQEPKSSLGRDLKRRLPEKQEDKSGDESTGAAIVQMQSRPDSTRSRGEAPNNTQNDSSERSEQSSIAQISQPTSKISIKTDLSASTAAAAEDGEAQTQGAGETEVSPEKAQILAALKENSDSKQEAMSDFMAKMQKDLGISPDKILQAFAKMDQQALEAPPEESKTAFLQNLDLKPEQKAVASDLYAQMVNKTGEASLNEKLIGIETGVNLKIVSPREDALRKLNEALDQANNSFFMRGQMPVKGELDADKMQAQLAALQLAKNLKTGTDDDQGDEKSADALALAGLAAGATAEASPEAGAAAGTAVNPMAAQLAALNANKAQLGAGLEDTESSTSSLGGRSAGAGKMDSAHHTGGAAKSGAQPANAANVDASGAAAKLKAEALVPAPIAAGGATPSAGAEATAGGAQAISSTATPAAAAIVGPAGMLVEKRPATPEEEQANVKELIRQAQFVLKKGGGEMSMQLKPEGIGQVKLKVSVENGQVNVQMLTDSDAAKHILEKGFHELKAELVAHQLKLDSMKVAVGTEIQKHMEPNQEHMREQARQAAGDFMGQFREDREGFRQGMFDGKGIRTYNRNQARPNIAAASTAAASAERRKMDKRLDLVA